MTFLTAATRYLNLTLEGGEKIFYREAGSTESPTVLLLHGFPTSSHQFRDLIPRLAPKYRVIAPDFPGYGFTEVPSGYSYTFDNLANTIDEFLEKIPQPPQKYSIYIFDYGAPVGLRLALKHPDRIQAILSQNGNAYDEGLGAFWDPIRAVWENKNDETLAGISYLVEYNATKWQYENGTSDLSTVGPEFYTLDQTHMDRPGNKDIQVALLYDYRNNLPLYPKFQEYFRKSQVPLLAAWGKNDAIFVPPGAEAFKRDLPNAKVELLDGGHFVSVTHTAQLAKLILDFLKDNNIS
ncbi:putative hydrolase [Dendryphion nanum]|uniref:Hydrolase n=1 Tax=Dendryphion nanum TaxID=256645 RepID=A0A9P9ILH0_9PLEO|nr:putative hydrolase [Dendryphion nanum]